jgi:hypothetical protein
MFDDQFIMLTMEQLQRRACHSDDDAAITEGPVFGCRRDR